MGGVQAGGEGYPYVGVKSVASMNLIVFLGNLIVLDLEIFYKLVVIGGNRW